MPQTADGGLPDASAAEFAEVASDVPRPPAQQRESLDHGSDTAPETGLPPMPDHNAESIRNEPAQPADGVAETPNSEGTIRVKVNLLSQLVNLAGELVLARNQIWPFRESVTDRVFVNAVQQLDLITSQLQEGIMRTRMQPIGNLWAKFPRIVRDLARQAGKQVTLQMDGQETELDRRLLEAIKDPLTHLIRNAVDHGLEAPAARIGNGKPAAGNLWLRAYHEGGLVSIEIADDGGGINTQAIGIKALGQNLVTQQQLDLMSQDQVNQLIFLPGFSTARAITAISGRGVGMDVVKTNIERIGGSVELASRPGIGTTVRIKIPLTLTIIPALIVTGCGQSFAIPQASLREVVALGADNSGHGIELVGNAWVYRLRDELVPVLRLADVLRHPPAASADDSNSIQIVVLQAGGRRFGLIVDTIQNTEEIVVKPVHRVVRQLPIFSGATITGDGGVMLILDIARLAKQLQLVQREDVGNERPGDTIQTTASRQHKLLVCQLADKTRIAVPLRDVRAWRSFQGPSCKCTVRRRPCHTAGGVLSLINLQSPTELPAALCRNEPVRVLVYADPQRQVGFVVDQILDVVEVPPAQDFGTVDFGKRRGLIENQITELIDLSDYCNV